ncbi:MAG: putative transport system ATP-binding protein [Acidimicrobiaceae bacterium]
MKIYGARRALDGVDLDVARGAFVSVMGPSGSGKSTLLHLLGGLDTPDEGDVVLDGESLSTMDDRDRTLVRRHRIGFIFQAFNLVPVLTAGENIALPAVIHGERPEAYEKRLQAVLDAVDLRERRDQLPSELSGGEQQRVAAARALFVEPEELLADEPTGNLDSRSGTELLSVLKRAQRDHGQTVVLVTHDPAAASFGDAVVYLRDGRVCGHLHVDGEGGDRAQLVLAWLQELGA